MGIKNVVEPMGIVLIFTTTALVNRARRRSGKDVSIWESDSDTPNASTPLIERPPILEFQKPSAVELWLPHPDTSRFHDNLLSRLLRKLPFLLEIGYWFLTYWPYQLLRARTAVWINSDPGRKAAIFDLAKNHAIRILDIEKWLGIDVEHGIQHFVLTRCKPWVMTLLGDIYVAHMFVGVAFLGYAYTYFPRRKYQRTRRTIFLDNYISFCVFTLYRCYPPRLMPPSYGFVDVLHPKLTQPGAKPPSDWSNNRFVLTIAAMPSLHFGTSLLIGCTVATWGRHVWLRVLGCVYPCVMAFVVISTANHWVLDCVAGAMVVGLGWQLNWVVLVFRPAEEWLFWLLRTEKPRDAEEVIMISRKEDDEV